MPQLPRSANRLILGIILCAWIGLLFFYRPLGSVQAAPVSQQNTVYVAEDQALCASVSGNCIYDDNQQEALVRAMQNTAYERIIIVGSYRLNQIPLQLNRAVTLTGQPNASLTTDNGDCAKHLFEVTAPVTVESLKINSGPACGNNSRTIFRVNTSGDVRIHHNTLEGGGNVIEYMDNSGSLLVSANHISGFEFTALRRLGSNSPGVVRLVANNILGKPTNQAVVDCASRGTADHNFWGLRKLPSQMSANCNVQDAKRLGAEIAKDAVGVKASAVQVTNTVPDANSPITLRTDTGTISAYLVDHGRLSAPAFPEISASIGTICSNTYDVFVDTVQDANLLTITLKYDNNCAGLMAGALQNLKYCQPNPLKVPLMWLDPSRQFTQGWDRTGDAPFAPNAQPAASACDLANQTVSVQIDRNEAVHPGLLTDLRFTPFVVAMAEAEIHNFALSFGNERVNITWSTTQEQSVSGYYVLRADTETGAYARVSPLVTKDKATNGVYLVRDDAQLPQGQQYWYKLEMMGTSGETIMSTLPLPIVIGATAQPTPYPGATYVVPTSGPYPAFTPFPTVAYSTPVPTSNTIPLTQTAFYLAQTQQTTITPGPSPTPPALPTPTPLGTPVPESITPSLPLATPTTPPPYRPEPMDQGVWLLKYGRNQLRYWWALPAGAAVSLLLLLVAGAFVIRKK